MRRVIVMLLSSVLVVGTALLSAPAEAAVYSPRNSTIFNNPKGTKAQKLAIITQLDRTIDAAPKYSTIKMAQYLFDIDSTANKLVAAHRRGVNVQVLIDDGNQTKQSKLVRQVLGTNKKALSFVTTCLHGCMSSTSSVMHSKLYLFSQAGSSKLVSMVASANPYTGNTFKSWNNIHTIVGDATIYNSLNQYFVDLIRDKDNLNYYRTTQSGKFKLYYFPRKAVKGRTTVVSLDVMNHVTCSDPGKGYGKDGKTEIKIAMWGWSAARMDLAKKVWELHNRGCKVTVILNSGRTNPKVIATLVKRSKNRGVMPVYDVWKDKNNNGIGEFYMHHKMYQINGKWFGHSSTKVVYTGSQNFTGPAQLANDDMILRILDNPTYDAYSHEMTDIKNKYGKKLTRAPRLASLSSSRIESTAGTQSTESNESSVYDESQWLMDR
jgi:phosphatidylserine/phosphatidylglycerophosphate/cardiolipin synthase-like enzyme